MSSCPVCDAPADDPVTLICGTLYCRKHILPLWNKQHKENAPVTPFPLCCLLRTVDSVAHGRHSKQISQYPFFTMLTPNALIRHRRLLTATTSTQNLPSTAPSRGFARHFQGALDHCGGTSGYGATMQHCSPLLTTLPFSHNVEQAQRRRTSTRSPSPPSSPSRAPALMPPDLSPMARSGLPSPNPAVNQPSLYDCTLSAVLQFGAIQPLVPQPGAAPGDVPVMCFRRGDAFIPVEV